MTNIELNGRTYPVASSWDELKPKQVHAISGILGSPGLTLADQCFAILWQLTGLNIVRFRQFYPDEIEKVLPATEFVFESISLTKNPLSRISSWHGDLQGPADSLINVIGDEFNDTELAFIKYEETKELAHLEKLIAIMWRPRDKNKSVKSENYNGDIRTEYNQFTVERRLPIVEKLSINEKFAVLNYYRGCRRLWEKSFPYVFSNESKEEASRYGWVHVFTALAKHDPTRIISVGRTNMMLVMVALDIMGKEAEQQEIENARNAQ